MDQLMFTIYTPLLLFYSRNGEDSTDTMDDEYHYQETDNISKCLKSSLSKTLTLYFQFAGRVKDHASIECNDDGAVYVKALVECPMSHAIKQPNAEVLKNFLPVDSKSSEASTGALLLVQANFFQCGGMAIGLCMTHKISDAATLSTFVTSWAAAAIKSCEDMVSPRFDFASLLPPIDSSSMPTPFDWIRGKFITRRYVFNASKIALLKCKATNESMHQPSRVQAVTALIWKCAMAASRSNYGITRLSVLVQTINLRKRCVPPLPENSMGNLIGFSIAEAEDTEISLQLLVDKIKKGFQDISQIVAKGFQNEEMMSLIYEFAEALKNVIRSDDTDMYMCSSWCKFPLYEADFGWGKPKWVCISALAASVNTLVIVDTIHGDGIEAWLSLCEEDMDVLERDQEFLEFATLNPNVY
ncbi:Transferase domain-containing protein [Cephalotus follicularis]|uniref:Transferase domain-containing protein n=1 Tax=Cephalotus follicularis TaxID=3775 RepID=A0A1Q3CW46_CEPFO|nr:Transferase domain-containing protein [Cephalotus follicularis]